MGAIHTQKSEYFARHLIYTWEKGLECRSMKKDLLEVKSWWSKGGFWSYGRGQNAHDVFPFVQFKVKCQSY